MSYVVSVGGDPINPSPFTYSQISMTANITLVWPSNTEDATYTATDWIDITSSAAYTATMPVANEAGTGQEVVFNNYGSFTITVNDSTGGNITTVTSGSTIRVWITDNSTAAGTWRVANIGSGTTQAVASMLAGYGLIAQAGLLSQSMPPLSYTTNATINAGARAALVKWTGGAGTLTLDSPATLGSNWFTNINNAGSGIVTLSGGGHTIDSNATVSISPGQGFTVETDGSNFFTLGKNPPVTTSYTLLTKSVAGNTDVTLTSAEAAYSIIYLTGALTGSINVIVPNTVNEWVMFNNTSGAYTLTVKTAAGTGVAVTQGNRRILSCDGTNVNYSDSVGTGTVTSITAGTGLSGGTITSSGTISLSNTAVIAGTYGSASRSATYTVNAQGQITNSTDSPISVSSLTGVLPIANGGTALTALGTANKVLSVNSGATALNYLYEINQDVKTTSDATFNTVNGVTIDNLAWTAYVPTITAGVGTFTSLSASGRYKQIGKTIFCNIRINITTNGTASGSIRSTLPTTASGVPAVGVGRATAVSGKILQAEIANGTNYALILNYDNTYPGANGEILEISSTYESV